MAIRIIGGDLKGRNINFNLGKTRPSSARLRKSLFDILGPLHGLSFCDLYAGSGAVGIEAKSRGSDFVEFVEPNKRAVRQLKGNLTELDVLEESYSIVAASAENWINDEKKFNVIFADPPYLEAYVNKINNLKERIIEKLEENGIFILQFSKRFPFFKGYDSYRKIGDDILYFWSDNPTIE